MAIRTAAWQMNTYPFYACGVRDTPGDPPVVHYRPGTPAEDDGDCWRDAEHRQITVEPAPDARLGRLDDDWQFDDPPDDADLPRIWANSGENGKQNPRVRADCTPDKALKAVACHEYRASEHSE